MTPVEVVKLTDGDGKFLSAVYQTDAGFVVVSHNHLLNKIVPQQWHAEQLAEACAMYPSVKRW